MFDESQKELFEEFKKEKGKIERIADTIARKRKKTYLSFSLENLVFILIVFMLALIVAFALGVERGKKIGQDIEPVVLESVYVSGEYDTVSSEGYLKPPELGIEAPLPETFELPLEPSVPEKKEALPKERLYTIQVISYKQKDLAEKEVRKLSAGKVEAFVIPSGNWYQVCAGRYRNTDEAKKELLALAKEYNGSFVRRINK